MSVVKIILASKKKKGHKFENIIVHDGFLKVGDRTKDGHTVVSIGIDARYQSIRP